MFSREYKTRGFIIARRKQGETSKVITVISKDWGRRSIIVRAARETKSRVGGLVEPFLLVDMVLVEGKSFDTLKDIALVRDYKILEQSLSGFGLGNIMMEILDKISRHETDLDIFGLLIDYLQCYERHRIKLARYDHILVFLSSFIMSILAISGRLPVVDGCAVCGLSCQSEEVVMVSTGLCHRRCLERGEPYLDLDKTTAWWLYKVVTETGDMVMQYDARDKDANKLFEVSIYLFRLFFDKDVESSFFLHDIFKMKKGGNN
ncbi:MAG: DNA repair protein RecO [Patescibacteria group bacterium]